MRKFFLSFSLIYLLLAFTTNINAQDKKVRIDVMYFHATTRCQTCLTIEKFAENSINSKFENEIKQGKISWQSIDFQDEKNEHFVDEYKLETQALIIAKFENGKQVKWKSLEKIWDLVGDFDKFKKYILKEVKSFQKS